MLQAVFEKHNSFLRPLKKKGFKEERVTTIGWYAIDKSTTLEANKSLYQQLPQNLRRKGVATRSTAATAWRSPLAAITPQTLQVLLKVSPV